MKIGEQIEALDKLLKQEKQRIVLHGETELSARYTLLFEEKKGLETARSEHGEDFEPDLSTSLVSSRTRSLDGEMSFTRKNTNALSFLKTLNQTVPSATEKITGNRPNSFSI